MGLLLVSKNNLGRRPFIIKGLGIIFSITAILILCFLPFLTVISTSNLPRVLIFLGRFHPVFVHLPIGWIIIALILEANRLPLIGFWIPKTSFSLRLFVIFLGAMSAFFAVLLGCLLSHSGDYTSSLVDKHFLFGLFLAISANLSFIALYLRKEKILYPFFLTASFVLLIVTGHFGASLSHGDGYLTEYIPNSLRDLFSTTSETELMPITETSSKDLLIYSEIIRPILSAKCFDCHGPDSSRGGLKMTDYTLLLKGGKSGPAIVPHDPERSELLRRILLPSRDEKHMPPSGRLPLSNRQLALISWWIKNGSPENATVKQLAPNPDIIKLIENTEPLFLEGSSSFSTPEKPISDKSVQFISHGPLPPLPTVPGQLRPVIVGAPDLIYSNLLNPQQINDQLLSELDPVHDHLIELNLAQSNLTDRGFKVIEKMSHLRSLQLQQTQVSDLALLSISKLPELEVVNLNETRVTDTGLLQLASLKKLKRIYLWKTAVTQEGENAFKVLLPKVEVIRKILPGSSENVGIPPTSSLSSGNKVSFNEAIQPILSASCYECHGPDSGSRKANLRLDRSDFAFLPRSGGQPVIIPFHPEQSEIIKRITSQDPEYVMPPLKSRHALTPDQVRTITAWIQDGAVYQEHWAYIKPSRPSVPTPNPSHLKWPKNPIDNFILKKLEQIHLEPQPEADRRALIRRVTLDLIGLPPTIDEVTAFLQDASPQAYEKVVDRLLSSPHYGEHEGRYWLDVARYADTDGLFTDNYRSIWPYRDWVIQAFNSNLPFDEFTIEQLAGDLLPHATMENIIATGFNRCSLATNENGDIPEEVAAIVAKDRVDTTAQVFLGETMGCASCHDHKFDPITTRDFYAMTAFFRNTTQAALSDGKPATPPFIFVPSPADRIRWEALPGEISSIKTRIQQCSPFALSTLSKLTAQRDRLLAEQEAIQSRCATTLVSDEKSQPAFAYILKRGQYDQPGEKLAPDVPKIFPPLPADQPKNRLALARWLVSPDHPLTARVTVNRYWQQLFGVGLVKTSEDFGIMGERPLNQPLLDWLAVEFRESSWNVKHLLKLMVMSAAYRQSATITPQALEVDPENRLVSRGPRYRLDAEQIRDQALAVSGLLSPKIGGASVKPYQPSGLWETVAMYFSTTRVYQQDQGESLYRRSLYTFWKRTASPPNLETFNAPTRETCIVRRDRTNTPLQALVLMNDPQFVEAARHLAANALHAPCADDAARFDYLSERLLARPLKREEKEILTMSLQKFLTSYRAHFDEAQALLKTGDSPLPTDLPLPDQAAWTLLASQFLNLDEFLNK